MVERERNKGWDAVCEAFDLEPTTRNECSRIGKVVEDLKAKGATTAKLKRAIAVHRVIMEGCMVTPESVAKHWDQLMAHRSPSGLRAESAYQMTMSKLNTFRQEEARVEADKEAAIAAGKPWPPKWSAMRKP